MASRAALSAVPIPPAPVDPSTANFFGNSGAPHQNNLPPPLSISLDPGTEPQITEMPDGGVEIDVQPRDAERATPEHAANLAEQLPEEYLNKLGTQVMDWTSADEDSRKEWYDGLTAGMKLLGLKMDDRHQPFEGASGVYDTLMLEAVIRNQAQTSAELLPAAGPVKTQIIGISTEQTEARASRIKDWTNWYLLEGAPEWVENREQLFLWRALCGSVFTKTYQDPILNRPVSPFITPDKLIISYYTDSDLATCSRITHIFNYNYKEVRERQLAGFYREIDLMPPERSGTPDIVQETVDNITGVRPSTLDSGWLEDREYEFQEQHVDIDLEGFEHQVADLNDDGIAIIDEETQTPKLKNSGLPLPYIITVETTSKRVVAIRRNWREGDESNERQNYFTHWRFIPGLGAYGIGFAHILGNPAKAATALQRQMIDAATLEMFPGGLRVKGMRMDDNNKMVGPCEFIEIDTGGLPINQAVSPMPYKGPSQWSFELWKAGRENAQSLGNMADISVGDGRQDAPVGTTLALLEAANRMMSATIKSAHRSLKREFKLFSALFGQYLPEKPYPFPVQGGAGAIMKADFGDDIDVIPVSDPNITSYAQRVTRAEMMLRMAQQAPQIHDLRAAYQNMYTEAGVDERKILAILPLPQQAVPTDPLSENQMALNGKPIAVGQYQDHQAHIQAHQVLSDQVPTIAAHIAEHLGAAMRINVEKTLGIQLPPMGQKLPPDMENKIALLVAQALQQLKTPQGQEPTPGQIAMAEIQVEAQKVQAQLQDIQARLAETAFKEQKANERNALEQQTRQRIALIKEGSNQARERTRQVTAASKNSIGLGRAQFK